MDLREVVDDLRKRVYDLERNQKYGSETITVVGTALGLVPPDTGAVTNPTRPMTTATLHEVNVVLDAPAATDVTFDLLKSGTSVGSVTCPTGFSDFTDTIEVGFSGADIHQIQATDPGSGYTSFTIQEKWRTTRDWWHPPVMMFASASEETFQLTVLDESNASGFVDLSIDISAGSHTVAVTFNDTTNPAHTFFGYWQNDPLGTATPFANSAGGVGPHTASSTDTWPGGTMTIRVGANAETAAINDFISYSIVIT